MPQLSSDRSGRGLSDDAANKQFSRDIEFNSFIQQSNLQGSFADVGLVPDVAPTFPAALQKSQVIAHGLMEVFVKTCQRWRLRDEEQMILLGYPDERSYFSQLKFGSAPISQDVRDRVGYMLHISVGLGAVYGELEEAELAWLNEPRLRFDGESAIRFMLRGKMRQLIAVSEAVLDLRNP